MAKKKREKQKIRVFTAFSGYDSQMMAMKRLERDYPDLLECELVGWSEIDEPAIKSHNAVFPESKDKNLGDISKIDWTQVPDFELFTYSSPCQDFSRCGIQRGGEKGSGTRSSLLWECERAIMEKRPKYCLLENVKALYSDKKFHPLLMRWKQIVDSYGYHSYIKVINAADMDVPQGRERVFMVSIRNDVIETVFKGKDYRFPAPMPRKRKIEDFLQDPDEVPEEYYLKANKLPKFLNLLTHAGDEFEKNLSEETKAAIKSAPMSIVADQPENLPLDSSVNNGLDGYVPKKSQNQLF